MTTFNMEIQPQVIAATYFVSGEWVWSCLWLWVQLTGKVKSREYR